MWTHKGCVTDQASTHTLIASDVVWRGITPTHWLSGSTMIWSHHTATCTVLWFSPGWKPMVDPGKHHCRGPCGPPCSRRPPWSCRSGRACSPARACAPCRSGSALGFPLRPPPGRPSRRGRLLPKSFCLDSELWHHGKISQKNMHHFVAFYFVYLLHNDGIEDSETWPSWLWGPIWTWFVARASTTDRALRK